MASKEQLKFTMNKKSLVSILMNCHNGEQFLEFSLRSIIEQTYQNWELIFWDNRSTDNSAKILKKFNDKRIRYFYAKKKTSLYEARNLAISKTKGEFIAFLDVDDIWSKEKLAIQIPKFQNKKIGLVYSNFFIFKDNKKKIAYKNTLPKGQVTDKIIKNYQIGILTVIIRKKFLKKKKIFDPKYDLIADYDFILDFSIYHQFYSVNRPLACYRIHENQLQKKKMILQANQFCKWFKNKKINKKFKGFDLTNIKKKLDYSNVIKDLEKSKFKTYYKIFKKFNLKNFVKISAYFLLPKKIFFRLINNV